MKSATKSPAWEKPKDILKRHVIKRKSSKCLLYVDTSQSASSISMADKTNTNGLDDSLTMMSEPLNPFKNILTINDSYPIDFSHLSSLCSSTPKVLPTKAKRSSSEMPKDLRLGTKIRVVSQRPFPWMTKVTTTGLHPVKILEEDVDLAIKSSMHDETEMGHINSLHMTSLSLLHASAIFYQYPSLSSIPMFPRLESAKSDKRLSKMTNLQSLCPKFMDDILSDWKRSFDHLFKMWKKKKRASFYLCAPSLTAFFVRSSQEHKDCSKSNPPSGLQIVITPTALVFAKLWERKVKSDKRFVNLTNEDCPKDFLPHLPEQGVDLDHDEWLKEIGISPKSTLRLRRSVSTIDIVKDSDDIGTSSQPATRTVQTNDLEGFQETKNTTILIQDIESITKLYELLLTSKLAFTRHGPLSGLPPTLIATTPFYKSVPGDLEMTSQITKKGGELKYILELSNGPILPSMQKKLLEFLKSLTATPTENIFKIQVNGRACYDGINEAVDPNSYINAAEFELDLIKDTYSW
uniref:Uncharacterized protein n=1 Tax=Ditylenchus dipsaci TaxID=166011 RepID=A0A915DF64_9BILA